MTDDGRQISGVMREDNGKRIKAKGSIIRIQKIGGRRQPRKTESSPGPGPKLIFSFEKPSEKIAILNVLWSYSHLGFN